MFSVCIKYLYIPYVYSCVYVACVAYEATLRGEIQICRRHKCAKPAVCCHIVVGLVLICDVIIRCWEQMED